VAFLLNTDPRRQLRKPGDCRLLMAARELDV